MDLFDNLDSDTTVVVDLNTLVSFLNTSPPSKKSKTKNQNYNINKTEKIISLGCKYSTVVKQLPNIHKTLVSIPSTAEKKRKRKMIKERRSERYLETSE